MGTIVRPLRTGGSIPPHLHHLNEPALYRVSNGLQAIINPMYGSDGSPEDVPGGRGSIPLWLI